MKAAAMVCIKHSMVLHQLLHNDVVAIRSTYTRISMLFVQELPCGLVLTWFTCQANSWGSRFSFHPSRKTLERRFRVFPGWNTVSIAASSPSPSLGVVVVVGIMYVEALRTQVSGGI